MVRLLEREWGAVEVVALSHGGLLTYLVSGDVVDIVTINAFAGLRVTTTNDNTRALRFYQRAGFRLTALHPDAVDEARKIKPGIPGTGEDGIPIRDEIELTMELSR